MIPSVVLALLACGVGADPPSLNYLLDAHESGIGLVHAVDMRIEYFDTVENDKPIQPPRLFRRERWAFEGRTERVRYWDVPREGVPEVDEEGHPLNYYLGDLLEDGTSRKVLSNWDPSHPFKLSIVKQGGVKAWYRKQQQEMTSPFGCPRHSFALFGIYVIHVDVRRSLREFVENSPDVHVVGQETVAGNVCWKLAAKHPDRTGGPNTKGTFEIFLDPGANYLIRKIVGHYPNPDPSNPNYDSTRWENEVLRFDTFAGGAMVPAEVRSSYSTMGGKVFYENRGVASEVTVNKPLPEDALNFRFPEGAIVIEDEVKDNWRNVHIWGPDNTPALTIHSMEEYDRVWSDEMFGRTRPKTSGTMWWWVSTILIVGGAVAIAITYFVRRRKE